MSSSPYLQITELRKQLVAHPVYACLNQPENVRRFMGAHVFAVWDFMSLLKALQRTLTCVEVPWLPPGDPKMTRLVNDIVLEEESDADGRGGYSSHFELYRAAMLECGADREPIDTLIAALRAGRSLEAALAEAGVPEYVAQFVRNTLAVALSGEPHRIAAAFFYGREDVIPDMFRACVAALEEDTGQPHERLSYYLARHIEVDGDSHGPQARNVMLELCGQDRVRHRQATETALAALRSRLALWDGLLVDIGPGSADGAGLAASSN